MRIPILLGSVSRRLSVALVGLVALALGASRVAAQGVAQTYYVPLNENAELSQFMTVLESPTQTTQVVTVVSIVASGDGTVVRYDHWEDGYESPDSTQASTLVWGDGDPSNGIPPGFATDHLRAGSVIALRNTIPVPRPTPLVNMFDGRDKITSSRAIAVTRAAWSQSGPVIAEAVEVFDTRAWGTELVAPVGQNAPGGLNMFQETWLAVMAKESGTKVDLQRFGGGTESVVLGEGQSAVFEDIDVADAVTADKPVQGQLMVGERSDSGGSLEMRWFALYPSGAWSNSYYTPIGRSSVDDDRTSVWLYNDGVDAIDVNWETQTGAGAPSVTVDPKESVRFDIPAATGAHFWSEGGEPFLAVSTVNSANDGGSPDNDTWDWSFALIPEEQLTTQALVGWGPGNSNVPPSSAANGSPVWVTPTAATTVYWDFDGDPTTGANVHGPGPLAGQRYDDSALVAKLASRKIFDNTDRDQTGMRVYSLGVLLAVAWGEDPDTAGTGNPFLDAGTAVRPLPAYSVSKSAKAVDANGDDDPDGLVGPGDFILYTVTITSEGSGAVHDVVLKDVLPEHLLYVPASTEKNDAPVADDTSPDTPFPLDEDGLDLGTLPAMGEIVVTFLVEVEVVNPTFPTTSVVNLAQVTTRDAGSQDSEVETPVIDPRIELHKTVFAGTDPDQCPGGESVQGLSGTQVVYCFRIVNIGNTHLSSVALIDAALGVNETFPGVLLAPFGAGTTSWAQAGTIEGDLVNEGVASGTPSSSNGTPIPNATEVEDTDTASVDLVNPAIDIQKTPDPQQVVMGGTATFMITVTNTGDVALANVEVTDADAPGCAKVIGPLAVGGSASYSCMVANVTAGFTNTATAVGTPPVGPNVTDTDTAAVVVIHPGIDIQKTPDTQTVASGGTATFTITCTNKGDVPLSNVTVTDPLAPDCSRVLPGILEPAGSESVWTYTCSQSGVTAAFTNVATVVGTPPVGSNVTDSDTAAVEMTASGCTRSQGYWSTHSKYGPAPYDATWALIGEDTTYYLSGQTWIQVIKAPTKGNPYYILGQQYIAARLNVRKGAAVVPAVTSALASAEVLFQTYTPAQAAGFKKEQKEPWIALASLLDQYNNGLLGVPHCDSQVSSSTALQ